MQASVLEASDVNSSSNVEALPVGCLPFAMVYACTVSCVKWLIILWFLQALTTVLLLKLQTLHLTCDKEVTCYCRMTFLFVFSPCFNLASCTGQNVSTNAFEIQVSALPPLLDALNSFCVDTSRIHLCGVAVIQHNLWRSHCSKGCSNFEDTVHDVDIQASKPILMLPLLAGGLLTCKPLAFHTTCYLFKRLTWHTGFYKSCWSDMSACAEPAANHH